MAPEKQEKQEKQKKKKKLKPTKTKEWSKKRPFYIFNNGPATVEAGRYADVQEIFSDAARFASQLPRGEGYEQYDKFMGVQFMTQTDGEQHARLRRLLMPAFSARRM